MAIVVTLDSVMDVKGTALNDLVSETGLTDACLSRIKAGRLRAVRLSTLDSLCKTLECQPGDVMKYIDDAELFAEPLSAPGKLP